MQEWSDFVKLEYAVRHTEEYAKLYGVWRWRGMYEYREEIYKILDGNGKIYDFGGAMAPLMYGVIVDKLRKDIYGRKVPYRDLSHVPAGANVFFTSHTLEHVDNLFETISLMYNRLRKGGRIIAHVPSTNGMKYWHPAVKKEHKRIFCLGGPDIHDPAVVVLDRLLGSFFKLDIAEYCGDECIMIIGTKV